MKILQVTSFFKPSWEAGGIARTSYQLAKRLAEKHDVTVVTTDGFKERLILKKNQPVQFEDMRVFYFRNISQKLAGKNVALPLSLLYKAGDLVKNYDVIHVHTFRTFLAAIICHFAKKFDVPYVLQSHGSTLYHSHKEKLKKLFDLFYGQKILQNASYVIALNEMEAEHYGKMGIEEDKIIIIPNGMDLSEYRLLPKRGQFKKKYGIKKNEKIILYLGRIHHIKGLDLLVDAFANLTEEMDDIRLVLAGPDDGFLAHLKSQIKDLQLEDKVVITGPLYDSDKLEVYVDAHVYVLPSRYDTFPNTVLEACACGTPPIITNRCGIAEFFVPLDLVVKFDKRDLVDKLRELLKDECAASDAGKKVRDLVEEKFDMQKIIDEYLELYEDVVVKNAERG